ncbi:MAG: hypothetical protein ACR2QO_14440 [Acidimicrobiales bacterium]
MNWKNGDPESSYTLETDDAESTITKPNNVRPSTVAVRNAALRSPASVTGADPERLADTRRAGAVRFDDRFVWPLLVRRELGRFVAVDWKPETSTSSPLDRFLAAFFFVVLVRAVLFFAVLLLAALFLAALFLAVPFLAAGFFLPVLFFAALFFAALLVAVPFFALPFLAVALDLDCFLGAARRRPLPPEDRLVAVMIGSPSHVRGD